MSVSSDSEIDLPSPTRGEKSKKVEFGGEDCEPGTSGVLDGQDNSGLKRVVPPREPAERRGRQRTTLIVCPTSLISHWTEQLEMHLDRQCRIIVRVHHGQYKALTAGCLEKADIVLTTYGTLASEYGNTPLGPLLKAKWLRVVLDEGHMIKNHNSKTAKAAQELQTVRKWIVTGTPIQNNLVEFWSLINWLDFGMYAGREQLRYFKREVERPCKDMNPAGFDRLQVLVDAVCLRRTKTDMKPDGTPLVDLPSKNIITRTVKLTPDERYCYDCFRSDAKDTVQQYYNHGDLLKYYAHIFALMMRMRQLCCHRELINIPGWNWNEILKNKSLKEDLAKIDFKKEGTDGASEEGKRMAALLREMIINGVTDDCSICLGDLKVPVISPCSHVFCKGCIEGFLDSSNADQRLCPLCRNPLQKNQLLEAGGNEDSGEDQGKRTLAQMEDIIVEVSSSKVNACLKELKRIRRDCPQDKMIVVSQFTSFLSIVQPLIKNEGLKYVRLDGTMSQDCRAEAVKAFQSSDSKSPTVMLLSLKAGGVGLNLTAANHLLLLDPAWNPATEWQCFDRTHRMGQKKEVFIYKYLTEDSIEETMLNIQNKKKDLITGAFTMPAAERRQQRIDDIRAIFDI